MSRALLRVAVPIALLLAAALGGCVGQVTTPDTKPPTVAPFTMELPIHVVAVGFDLFDDDLLRSHLEVPPPVYELVRAFTTAHVQQEPLQYDVRYVLHEAPAAFAQELFAFMPSVAETGPPHPFLAAYDRAGPNRICPPAVLPVTPPASLPEPLGPPACGDIDRIDAQAVEAWIAENRAAHGLDFGGASQTIFVLDSFTRGYLPRDGYHQYRLAGQAGASQNLRAWGGAHDFVFLDVGAAPNQQDYRPWWRMDGQDWSAETDGPIWEFEGDMDRFYRNLARNARDAVEMLWARDPIYPYEYAERYVLPTYVIVDSASQMNPDSPLHGLSSGDLARLTDEATITQAFRDLVPWAQVEQTFEYIVLPGDDPDLAAALQDSKQRHSGDRVDFGVLKAYFRDNWERYVPEVEGARVYPTFAFWFGEPSVGTGAFSDGDEWGRSFGVFFDIADNARACLREGLPVCTRGEAGSSFWPWWNYVFVHELGHSFGLMHTHDSGTLEEGEPGYYVNWLWDSTASAMTYRHTLPGFDAFDKELILRHNAVHLARDALAAGGDAQVRAWAEEALALVAAGEPRAALDAAVAARRASGWAPAPPLVPGEADTTGVVLPLTAEPFGRLPRAPSLRLPFVDTIGFSWKEVAFQVPEGTTAVLFEFRERDAPTHARWAGFLELYDAEGDWVTGAYGNRHDKVVLEDLSKCAGGCTLAMWAYSGAATAYDVTVTPLMPPG